MILFSAERIKMYLVKQETPINDETNHVLVEREDREKRYKRKEMHIYILEIDYFIPV